MQYNKTRAIQTMSNNSLSAITLCDKYLHGGVFSVKILAGGYGLEVTQCQGCKQLRPNRFVIDHAKWW